MGRVRNLAMVGATFLLAAASGEYMQSGRGPLAVPPPAPVFLAVSAPTQATGETLAPLIPAAFGAVPVRMAPLSLTAVAEDAAAVLPPLSCSPRLALQPRAGAMLALTLDAPCAAGARVLVDSNGLTFTALTGPDGRLALDLPAMANPARVTVHLPGAQSIAAGAEVPDLAALQRVAVTWQGADRFALHALEPGAAFGSAGDISAATPGTPQAPAAAKGGFLVALGDASVDQPQLAEVYSLPRRLAASHRVHLLLDAPVGAETCGRQMHGRILTAGPAKGPASDSLVLDMPSCDPAAFGQFVELPDIGPARAVAMR